MTALAFPAIIKAPGSALPNAPVLLRVPSGKIANTPPSSIKSIPCFIAVLSAPPLFTRQMRPKVYKLSPKTGTNTPVLP